jgi:hypothetical protein
VESSCKRGNESYSSIKCWELPSGCTTCGLSSGTQLHRVSQLVIHHRQTCLGSKRGNVLRKGCGSDSLSKMDTLIDDVTMKTVNLQTLRRFVDLKREWGRRGTRIGH